MPYVQIPDTPITRFFRDFERHSDSGDIPSLVPQFAETFMAGGPHGVQCVQAGDFAVAMPRRKALFDSLGCQSTSLVSLDEQPLDTRYFIVRTRWRMVFLREGREFDVFANSTFIVDTAPQDFRIVFYLAHQDHLAMLRERGILA